MVQAYSENVTVNAQSAFPFNNVVIEKGCTATIQGNTILLEKAGIYCVMVDASVAPSVAGEIIIDLQKDGQILKYAAAQATGAVGETTSLAFNTLIRCPQNNTPCCLTAPTSIVLWNDMEEGNVTGGANIVVTKIC